MFRFKPHPGDCLDTNSQLLYNLLVDTLARERRELRLGLLALDLQFVRDQLEGRHSALLQAERRRLQVVLDQRRL